MALYRDIQFNIGTVTDLMGAVPTVTGATFNKDKKGWAIRTGLSKYIQYDRQLLPDGAFSVVAWIKCDKIDLISRVLPIISNNTFGAFGILLNSNYNGSISRPIMYFGLNNFKYFDWVADTKWHCFIFTIDGGLQTSINNSKMYVDNIEKAQMAAATSSGTPNARNTFVYTGGANSGSPIGKYDSRIKVYDHVLTAKEREREQIEFESVQPLTYQKRLLQLPKPTDLKQQGLIAAYNMKPVGNILHDISGNGKHITIPVKAYNSTLRGLKSNNINDGTAAYNLVPTNLSTTNFSYCLSHDELTTSLSTLFYKGGNKYIGITASGILKYFEGSQLDFTPQISATPLSRKGTIIFTYDNITKVMMVYIDGIYAGQCAFINPIGTNNFDSILNVGNYAGRQINGVIKDIRIYNRVLTSQEIKAYHNSFNEVILHEKFEDMAVGSSKLPNGWIKNGGSFVCAEQSKKLQSGELLTNNEFTNWTGTFPNEIPDGWVAFGTHGVNNYVTQSPIGQCRIYTTGAAVGISKTCLTVGRYYKLTFDLISISGTMEITGLINGVFTPTTINTGRKVMYGEATSSILTFKRGSTCDFTIDNIYLEEVYPLNYKVGTKYLRCVTAGIVAIPCKQARGTWEWDWYKGGDTNTMLFSFIQIQISGYPTGFGYTFRVISNEGIAVTKHSGGATDLMLTGASYITNNTWYRIRITISTSGVFTVWILGGNFTNWTLVSTTGGSGTNPVTDNTYTTSNYFVMDLDANDRVGNILIQSQIKQ